MLCMACINTDLGEALATANAPRGAVFGPQRGVVVPLNESPGGGSRLGAPGGEGAPGDGNGNGKEDMARLVAMMT